MGVPCDEILGNHSKGLPGCFYTLWGISGRSQTTATGQLCLQSQGPFNLQGSTGPH